MTKNDNFYKILFAIEMALIPLVIFANIFLKNWATSLFIGGLVLAKIWREIFKEKDNKQHTIISAIANMCEFGVLIIYFATQKLLIMGVAITAVVIAMLYNLLKVVFVGTTFGDTIDSVDFCMMIFEVLTLISFAVMFYFDNVITIALWTIILTGAVSVIYKIYYGFRYDNWWGKIKAIFTRR